MILNPYSSLKPNDKILNLVDPCHFYQLTFEQLNSCSEKLQEPYESGGALFSKVAGYNLTKKGLTRGAVM